MEFNKFKSNLLSTFLCMLILGRFDRVSGDDEDKPDESQHFLGMFVQWHVLFIACLLITCNNYINIMALCMLTHYIDQVNGLY